MAIAISLLYMFLLRCLVGCIVWFSCIGVILAFIALGIFFLYNGGVISGTAATYIGYLGLPTVHGSDYYATYGYICFGISALLLIILLCCCNRLRLAVAVCKVAGRFVIRVCQSTLVPIFLMIVLVGMWAACLVCMVYLLSVTTFTISNSTDVLTSVANYGDTALIELYYFIFATLWSNALIGAIGIFVIASACCMWYYNHGANEDL